MSTERTDHETEIAERFAYVAELETAASGPPVEEWDPSFTGDLDIRVARDGRWFYEGRELWRQGIKSMFAKILRLESDGEYYLVTPVEKYRITVEDAPLLAHSLHVESEGSPDQVIWLRTNMDDELAIGENHPISMRQVPETDEPVPYVIVRRNLQARLERSCFYDLVSHAEERMVNGRSHLGVTSQGSFFSLGEAG